MAKFNASVKGPKTKIKNHEGGEAFRPSDEMSLYMQVCASLMSGNSLYKTENQTITDLRNSIHKCSRRFVLQLANYARNEMKLRTIPIILLAEASIMHNSLSVSESKSDVREYCPKIIKRADEPGELISYWSKFIGNGTIKRLPNALKKGIADSLRNFNEYQLAKYNRSSAEFKLHDIFNIVHPKPRNENEANLFRKVIEGNLKTPDTWETKISQGGSTTENWNEIAPKMGTMALLRNLRNFEQKGAHKAIDVAIERFTNEQAVLESKQLPFRWLAADNEITNPKLKDALRDAVEISVKNIPRWEGKTAIFADLSGSMDVNISGKSKMTCKQAACMMAAMAHGFCDESYTGAFGATFKPISLSTRDSVLTNAVKISKMAVGHSTNAWKGIEYYIVNNLFVDRFIVFTDCQLYDSTDGWYSNGIENTLRNMFKSYKSKINPNAKLFTIDLSKYGMLTFPEADRSAAHLCGFSEKLFDFIPEVSRGNNAVNLIKEKF